MDAENILGEIEDWLVLECIEENEADAESFFVEKFEHAAIIRWGSEEGDFPRLGHSPLTDTFSVIISGEMLDGRNMIADLESKFELNLDQLAYKYLLEILMKDCEKGYELNEIKAPNGDVFRITVEKLKPAQPEEET